MPPRWACVLIVAGWLAANGWLFYRDLLPRLLPDQPPPYTVDLLEEVQDRRWMRPVGWTVSQNRSKVLAAKMRVEHPARDTFELVAEYRPLLGAPHAPLHNVSVAKMTSAYRVNAAGDLLGVSFHLEGQVPALRGDFILNITGDVEGERFRPVGRLRLPGAGLDKSVDLPGAEVRRGGGVVLPLHPVNRLRGLRPGQSWTAVAFDPAIDALRDLGGRGEPRRLHCRVRDQEEPLGRGRRPSTPCLVIDMEGGDLTVRAWVARDTGLVLAQEVISGTAKKDHTALERD